MSSKISLRTMFIDKNDLDSNSRSAFFDGLLGREPREENYKYVRAYGLGCSTRVLDDRLDRYFALQDKPL